MFNKIRNTFNVYDRKGAMYVTTSIPIHDFIGYADNLEEEETGFDLL